VKEDLDGNRASQHTFLANYVDLKIANLFCDMQKKQSVDTFSFADETSQNVCF